MSSKELLMTFGTPDLDSSSVYTEASKGLLCYLLIIYHRVLAEKNATGISPLEAFMYI